MSKIEKPVKVEMLPELKDGLEWQEYMNRLNKNSNRHKVNKAIDQSDKYWEQKLSVFMEEMTEIRDYGDMDEEIYNLIRGKIHKITKE